MLAITARRRNSHTHARVRAHTTTTTDTAKHNTYAHVNVHTCTRTHAGVHNQPCIQQRAVSQHAVLLCGRAGRVAPPGITRVHGCGGGDSLIAAARYNLIAAACAIAIHTMRGHADPLGGYVHFRKASQQHYHGQQCRVRALCVLCCPASTPRPFALLSAIVRKPCDMSLSSLKQDVDWLCKSSLPTRGCVLRCPCRPRRLSYGWELHAKCVCVWPYNHGNHGTRWRVARGVNIANRCLGPGGAGPHPTATAQWSLPRMRTASTHTGTNRL